MSKPSSSVYQSDVLGLPQWFKLRYAKFLLSNPWIHDLSITSAAQQFHFGTIIDSQQSKQSYTGETGEQGFRTDRLIHQDSRRKQGKFYHVEMKV